MFTLKDVKNFIQGTFLEGFDRFIGVSEHEKEQAIYRSLLCWDCTKNGRCLICGCGTPGMYFAPSKVDSKGKWDQWVSKEKWEEFKQSKMFTQKLLEAYELYKKDQQFLEVFSRLGSVGRSDIINTDGSHDSDTNVEPKPSPNTTSDLGTDTNSDSLGTSQSQTQ